MSDIDAAWLGDAPTEEDGFGGGTTTAAQA